MPSFVELLEESMPFTAARGAHGMIQEIGGDFRAIEPGPINDNDEGMPSAEQVLVNRIWQFDQDAAEPARFDRVRVWSRGMGMNYTHPAEVLRKLEFEDLRVERVDGTELRLRMTPEFVVGRWSVTMGEIPESDVGLWQLEAKTDVSLLVAFVFEDVDGTVMPMTREKIDALGPAFMPSAHLPPPCLDILATDDVRARVCIGNARYLALVSLTTCRERSDFAPGDIIGFARFYPHAMVMASDRVQQIELKIRLERPPKAMTHGDPEMSEEIKPLLVADSNRNHSLLKWAVPGAGLAVPLTSNIYDYYLLNPHDALGSHDTLPREVTLADRRFRNRRTIESCVARDGGEFESITKWPRQGQFDNVHLAPRMKITFPEFDAATGTAKHVNLDEIAMVFICLHDCVHMHVRWAAWAQEKALKGFENGLAYAASGAPGVPENQTVRASFPNGHTLVYRATARDCDGGEWQVFCHHGAAYAIDAWPGHAADRKRAHMSRLVARADIPDLIFPSMPLTWAAFYWRCRWTQDRDNPGFPMERLEFVFDRVLG